MTRKKLPYYPLIFTLLALVACQSEEVFEPVYEVPAEIQVHVDTFLQEATERGYNIDITNLIIEMDPGMDFGQCGTCNSLLSPHEVQKVIRLNPDCMDLGRAIVETLIYHELGHCVLGRDHDDRILPNGDPRSLMVAGNIYVYSPCTYALSAQGCDYTFKRPYYLDELFDETTTTPTWGE